MQRTHFDWFTAAGWLATFVLLAGLAVVGCRSDSSCSLTSCSPGNESDSNHIDSVSPVVAVTGGEAVYQLGEVAPSSTHDIIFAIDNPTDRTVKIKKVRSNCACTTPQSPPDQIDPRSTARFILRFQAPREVSVSNESQVLVQTDDPQRKTIALVVKSRTVKR